MKSWCCAWVQYLKSCHHQGVNSWKEVYVHRKMWVWAHGYEREREREREREKERKRVYKQTQKRYR